MVSRIIDVISAIFATFLYTLAACGILQEILGGLVALNAIDTAGETVKFLGMIVQLLSYTKNKTCVCEKTMQILFFSIYGIKPFLLNYTYAIYNQKFLSFRIFAGSFIFL